MGKISSHVREHTLREAARCVHPNGVPATRATGGWQEAIMVETQRLGQRWAGYKATKATLFWSGAACAVATVVVGFTWGGWVTGASARSMAEAAAVSGRDGLVAAICVDRFQAGRDAH